MVTGIVVQLAYLVVFGGRRDRLVPPQGHPLLTGDGDPTVLRGPVLGARSPAVQRVSFSDDREDGACLRP